MARPATFDQQQALENAMQVFWRKGYASTSMRDLTDATHLQPGSLYGAFKNKRNLFLESLDHYFSILQKQVETLLESGESPLSRIRNFFNQLLSQSSQDKELKGCLLVNTLLEIPADDEEINHRVNQMLSHVEKEFQKVLQDAQQQGELSTDNDPEKLARLLITGIFGIRVYNRMNPNEQFLKETVDNLLSILDDK